MRAKNVSVCFFTTVCFYIILLFQVQRKLADLKLAPGLSELFDQFIWKCQV